jgi:hypothetical protein
MYAISLHGSNSEYLELLLNTFCAAPTCARGAARATSQGTTVRARRPAAAWRTSAGPVNPLHRDEHREAP